MSKRIEGAETVVLADKFERVRNIREPVTIVIPKGSRVKKWAYDNAYTLIFLTMMFIITWVVEVVARIFF